MPSNDPTLPLAEVSYVCEAAVVSQVARHSVDDQNVLFNQVDLEKFTALFEKIYPNSLSPEKISLLWNNLLGHFPDCETTDGLNPTVTFLTDDSAKEILKYYRLFDNGIDFLHLPLGFCLIKNNQTNLMNVLHYSPYLKEYQADSASPLAIVLTPKDPQLSVTDELVNQLSTDEKKWYNFLLSKIYADDDFCYCSKIELEEAFKLFLDTVKKLGLLFYPPNFNRFCSSNINPIVLLSRWQTVLTNRYLKATDRAYQWQVLCQLPLVKSHQAIRAITDYQYSDHPCGFLIPEMLLYEENFVLTLPKFIKTGCAAISQNSDFWRFIAYQPHRNSISFYENALRQIYNSAVVESLRIKMALIVAASTTGINHTAKHISQGDAESLTKLEKLDTEKWQAFCHLVGNLASINPFIERAVRNRPDIPEEIQTMGVTCLSELKQQPNLLFLNSIISYISHYISQINLIDLMAIGMGNSKLFDPLHKLSINLAFLIRQYRATFYTGARFYFQHGDWQVLSIDQYVNLVKYLDDHDRSSRHWKSMFLVPCLSTFQIKTRKDVDLFLIQLDDRYEEQLTFCFTLFQDVQVQQTQEKFNLLTKFLTRNPAGRRYSIQLKILNFLEKNFSDDFPVGYFPEKKHQLECAEYGLTDEQKASVVAYHFSPAQTQSIISIQSILVKNQQCSNQKLDRLNQAFLLLGRVVVSSDFTLFVTRLDMLCRSSPPDLRNLLVLLNLLTEQRTLERFNQIYFCNKKEKIKGDFLLEKFIFFIGFATEILPQEKIAIDVLLALEETLAALILNSFSIPDHLKLQLKPLVFDLHAFLKKYPHTQDYLLSAFGYLAGKNKPNYLSNAIAFLAASKEIIKILDTATNNSFEKENQLIFYGLLAHFAQKPTGLIDLLTSIKKLTSLPKQHFVLQLISRLLSNKQSIDGFTAFIDALSDDHVYEIMASECAIPPYPDIQTLTTWLREDNFTQRYATYSAKPYGERRQDYRFALAEASQKKTAFLGVADDLFQEDLLVEIDSLLESNRKLLPRELRVSIDVLRKQSDERELTKPEIITLLCCCIEMLAKTTPQLDPQPAVLDSKLIISQELNTTQVMALVAMLLGRASIAQNEMISEIKAGEGKSRIMMLLAACFSLQGKTIDFITQNMMLAERDYFSYQMFFVALGIKTSLISLGTPKQLYQVGGINFSDSSFLLLQNKSDIDRLQGAYVDPDPKKRYLLLDEVDAFIYSEDPFNYAGCSLKLNDFVWVYSYLVSFVRECLSAQQTITKNGFLGSLISKGIDPTQFAALKNLDGADNKQIESWLQAAQTALKMRLGELYDVTEPGDANLIVVRDHEGRTRYTRKVEVLKNGRPQERCSFMGGVQQCLAVMQNQEIDKVQNNITDGEDSFVILPEHATQRAIFPTTFIEQRYGQGMVYGASGTTRSDAEREHPEIKDPKRQYIIVPRHKISRRVDKNILAANGQAQHIVFIKRSILAVIAKHPVLLICRDDNQSQIFFNALINDEDFKREIRQIQRIHARTLIKDEKQSIKDSAKIGCVTIATVGMCGRGVDIEADHLIVLLAYVATPWDEEQVKGRTARIGKPGEYRVIIDITDPVCVLNGKTHNIHSQVIAAQYNLELRAIVSWEMTNLYADFLERCHQKFLTAYGESADPHDLLQRWIVFLAQILIEWSTVKKQLLLFVEPGQNIEASIACFKKFIQQYMDKIPQTDENHCAQVDFNNGDIKPYFQRAQYRKEIFQQHKPKIIIQQKYDPADDGQARIYSTLFAQTKAVLRGERRWFADYHAWREGRGVLFPDLTALFKGERPLFANLKTTMHQYFNAASTKPARKLSAQNSKKISASGVNKFFQQHGKKIVFMALITSGFTALSVLTFGATAILPAIYIIYAAYGAGGILGAGLLSYGGLRLMKKVAPGAKKFTQAISNSVVAKNKDRSVEKSKTIGLPEAVERAQYLIHCVNDYNKRLGQDYKKELAKIISQLAAHLNTIRVNESDTLLHWAVYCENVYAVDLLINQGADPSIKNGQGQIAADLITAERTFVNANMLDLLKKVDVQPPDSTLTNTTQSNLSIANYNPLYVPAHVFASATTVSLQPLLSADIDQEDGYVVNPSLAPAG